MGKYVKIVCIIMIFFIINGCSMKDAPFIIPVNYTGDAIVKVFTDKTENTYDVKILCRDGNYNFIIGEGEISWNIAYYGNSCYLSNDKFPDNSITIDNFKIAQSLLTEFDLGKYDNTLDAIPEELIYWDGTYKHVLTFSKENLLPETIFIYKNENLVKTIQYEKINLEQ